MPPAAPHWSSEWTADRCTWPPHSTNPERRSSDPPIPFATVLTAEISRCFARPAFETTHRRGAAIDAIHARNHAGTGVLRSGSPRGLPRLMAPSVRRHWFPKAYADLVAKLRVPAGFRHGWRLSEFWRARRFVRWPSACLFLCAAWRCAPGPPDIWLKISALPLRARMHSREIRSIWAR